ncbi:MAG TPA: hypothetical protein DD735_10325 [Clostridiales bacterium]|nr:hypothetical protein [Clostridiales bacterium]
MKRVFAALLIVCIGVSLTGCGNKRESAEMVVKDAIEAIKACDAAKVRKYWGNENIGAESGDEMDEEALKAILGGIIYEIMGSEENDGAAVVDVKITNTDMGKVMTDVVAEVFPTLLAEAFKPESEQMSDEDSDKLFSDTLIELLARPDNPQITNTVKVALTLKDDVWVIDSGNDAAADAMLGGISSFADAINEAFEGSPGSDNSGSVVEQTPEEKLFEIRNWLVSDIWNDGFCDMSWYYSTGKSSIGQSMDAEFSLEQLEKAIEKKSEYDVYISDLPEKYSEIASVWSKLSEQVDVLYTEVQSRGTEVTGDELDTGLYNQYFNAFDDAYRQLD